MCWLLSVVLYRLAVPNSKLVAIVLTFSFISNVTPAAIISYPLLEGDCFQDFYFHSTYSILTERQTTYGVSMLVLVTGRENRINND